MLEQISAAAARIRANPLGRLMYGQRELFHSNLLAWFFEELPEAADAVFKPLTEHGAESARSVAREQGNLDLVMLWPDHAPLVIENKVFSMPSREQLLKYERHVASWRNRPTLVLLSPSAPSFLTGRWRHIDYAELAMRIRDALPDSHAYEFETMRRYATLASDLNDLIESVAVESDDEPVWVPDEVLDALGSSQLRAALHKARAQRVAVRINDLMPSGSTSANSAMTRSQPLTEILAPTIVDGVPLRAGWQYQNGQFRRSVLFEQPALVGRDDASLRAREAFCSDHPELFWIPASLPQLRGGRSQFNHYKPESVYQYVKVGNLTVGELAAAALAIHANAAEHTGVRRHS